MPAKKILIIDDDPSVTELLKLKLEAAGALVATSNAARQAIELAGSFAPQLIVCDIDLGQDGDGGMIAHELAKNPATTRVPILFLSSMVTPADSVRQSGGRRLISKKIPIAEIVELILNEAGRKPA